jgi:hypothetical protein
MAHDHLISKLVSICDSQEFWKELLSVKMVSQGQPKRNGTSVFIGDIASKSQPTQETKNYTSAMT